MTVEIFTLCEAATSDLGGKLNILGSFDHLWAPEAPITHPLCALAVKLRFEKLEEGLKKIAFSFIDSDGKSVMPHLEAQTQIRVEPSETSASVLFALTIQHIKLPHFGEYSVGLAVNGRMEATVPLYVRKSPSPPPARLPAPDPMKE